MSVIDFSMTVGSQVLDPATHLPLMEMTYSNNVLEERFAKAGGLNFFNPEVDGSWKNDLAIHQSIRIRFKNYRNPFTSVGVSAVAYEDGQTCPPVIDGTCDTGCISTENSWRYEDVKYKNKFRVGVSWCVETEKLLYQDAESRFSESIDDGEQVQSTVGWSELVTQAVAAPATTLLPKFQAEFPTHYFDAASADQYTVLTKVFNYMKRVYQGRWDSEFVVLADPQLELDLADPGTSDWHRYDKTGIPSAQSNVDTFVAGGWAPMQLLPKHWGKAILMAPDVVGYYPTAGALAGSNLNPFQNADGSKYYVVIVSKRAYFHGAVSLMDKKYFPATCDNKNDSIQQTWMSFYKILFPNEVFVVAFDQTSGASS